jgi:glutathione S-transferase
MKLYVTYISPYARLARILVLEKGMSERVDIVEAKTRTFDSPYYRINPSGRVPYLVDDAGIGMEDSQLICSYLDNLDGKPRFHQPLRDSDWAYRRLEATARGFCAVRASAYGRLRHLVRRSDLVAIACEKRTWRGHRNLAAPDPQRSSTQQFCCDARPDCQW